jgi:hypothetical protein
VPLPAVAAVEVALVNIVIVQWLKVCVILYSPCAWCISSVMANGLSSSGKLALLLWNLVQQTLPGLYPTGKLMLSYNLVRKLLSIGVVVCNMG